MQIDRSDIPEVITLRESKPKAAKPHTCTSCGRQIEAGQTYKSTVYTVDGELKESKRCQRGRYC